MVLVPCACEDEFVYETKRSWYLWLAKLSLCMERSGLGTFGLGRWVCVWNEVVLEPLACEDEFVYGTKWSWYHWLAKMSVGLERSGLGTFGLRR